MRFCITSMRDSAKDVRKEESSNPLLFLFGLFFLAKVTAGADVVLGASWVTDTVSAYERVQ